MGAGAFVMAFVQVVADSNQTRLRLRESKTPAHDSLVVAVVLQDAGRTLGLSRSVHPQQGSVNALRTFQSLPAHGAQFPVGTARAISIGLLALSGIGTAAAAHARTAVRL